MGDFNLILDKQKDKIGGRQGTHEKVRHIVSAYIEEEALVDVWRLKHPESNLMTWKVLKPKPIYERLDLILMSVKLIEHVGMEGISPTYLSDHDIPWVTLSCNKPGKGSGFWRLNVSLLSESEYCKMIEEIIDEILKERKTVIEKLEWIKDKVRERTIKFSAVKKRSRKNKLLLFERKLMQYNQMLIDLEKEKSARIILHCKEILNKIQEIERERDEIITYKVRGSMMRACRDWTQYTDHPTKYYLNLEGNSYKRKNRYSIKTEDRLINGVKEVLIEQHKFYEELYKNEMIFNKEDFSQFTSKLVWQKLKSEDKKILESEISPHEVRCAVFALKKD